MKKVLLVVVCCIAFMGVARAEVINYTGVAPGETVNINAPTIPYSGGAYAGMYNFNIEGPSPFAGSYKGFCVDPQMEITPFTAVIIAVTDGSKYEAAAYLMQTYYGQTSLSNQKAAQVQLAIWELVWDYNSYDLATGAFQTSAYITEVNALIAEATGALATYTPSGVYVATNAAAQDFMFQVPEPMTVLLLGLGMIGVAGIRRKMKL
jgi:hypothetical protein